MYIVFSCVLVFIILKKKGKFYFRKNELTKYTSLHLFSILNVETQSLSHIFSHFGQRGFNSIYINLPLILDPTSKVNYIRKRED